MRRRCPAARTSPDSRRRWRPSCVARKLSIFRPQSYTATDCGGSLSGRANLAWQFTDGLFAYLGYAHGYKSGGLNMSGLPLDAANQPALATAVIEDETQPHRRSSA